MKIAHHPQLESLMSCSAGSMPEAFAAVMASHIEMCAECRNELAFMETIGTELFRNMAPAPISREAPLMAARRAESERGRPAAASPKRGDVPDAIAKATACYLDDVPWQRLTPGVMQYPIRMSQHAKGDLRLIKIAPGVAIPEHGHGGSELTLVLRGSYSDKTGTYKEGDVADLSESVEHSPVADAKEGCICLIASDRKIRFKSLIARLVQPFTGV